jgi:hypothetical protein
MTKAELVKLFPAFSPKRAFVAGENNAWEVVGRYVNVAWVTNTWDVYIRASQIRTNALAALFPKAATQAKVVDDGEAWWQSKDADLVREWLEANRGSLGIAKRRPGPVHLQKRHPCSQNPHTGGTWATYSTPPATTLPGSLSTVSASAF